MLIEHRDRRHHHARRAIAALKRFGVEKRLLHRMEPVAARQTFNGSNRFARRRRKFDDAGAQRRAVDQHRTRAAVPFAAAELAASQIEVVAEDREQAVARVGADPMGPAVDTQLELGH